LQNEIKLTINLVFIYLFLVFPQHARTQEQSLRGTIVVAAVSQNKAAIAADSRGVEQDGRHMDSDCKISALGNKIVFASAGLRRTVVLGNQAPPQIYDSHNIAHLAFSSIFSSKTAVTREAVNTLAHKWSELVVDFFAKLASQDPAPTRNFLAALPSMTISGGLFAGVDRDGQITVIQCRVFVEQLSLGLTPEIKSEVKIVEAGHPISFAVMGRTAIAQEFFLNNTARSRAQVTPWKAALTGKSVEEATSLWAVQLVQWTIRYGPSDVGGPIDLITINRAGIKWTNRKATCKASE
jgi:hypothetical protein